MVQQVVIPLVAETVMEAQVIMEETHLVMAIMAEPVTETMEMAATLLVITETTHLDQVRVMVQQVETLLHLMVAMEEIMVIMEAIHHLHIQMEEMVVDQILLLQEDLDSDSLNVEPDYLILEWIN